MIQQKRWRRLLLALLICTPVLVGCWDTQELEHMFYVHTIGIDYQDNKYTIYAQILNLQTLSKEAAKAEKTYGVWIGKGTGSSVHAAIHDLYSTTPRKIYWGHLSAIVISDDCLKQEGIQDTLDYISHNKEIRYTPWIYSTDSPVFNVLSISPIIERSPVFSILSDPLDVVTESTQLHPMRLHQFILNLLEPARPKLITNISVKGFKWAETKPNPQLPMTGVGLLRTGKLVGLISTKEAVGLRWMSHQTKTTLLILQQDDKSVASLLMKHPKYKIQTKIVRNKVLYDVDVKVTGEISELGQPLKESQLETMAAKEIEEEIRATYQTGQRFGIDIYGLSDSLYRRNPKAFHQYVLNGGQIQLSDESLHTVHVSVRIKDAGKTMESAEHYS